MPKGIYIRKTKVRIINCTQCGNKCKHYAKNSCRRCYWKLRSKEYYENNRERIDKRMSKWGKEYYLKNKEHIKQQSKNWAIKNPIRKKELHKKFIKANPRYRREYTRSHYLSNPDYKLRTLLKNRIWYALKGIKKSASTIDLVGCSIPELWNHLEKQFAPGMTRKNYGKWHVDHIKPLKLFTELINPEQQREAFHFSNLQPLWAIDNLKKSIKYDITKVDNIKKLS